MAITTAFGSPTGTLKPLTTAFTQPSSCTSLPYVGSNTESTDSAPLVDRYFESDCFPESFLDLESTYSPGMCPFGQTSVSATEVSGITSAQCCPEGEWSVSFKHCVQTVSTPFVVQHWHTGTGTDFLLYTSTTLTAAILAVDAVHVFYQQKDLSLFPAGYTPGSIPTAGTSMPPISSPTLITETSSQQTPGLSQPTAAQSSSGLSSGVKTGIGIGVGLGVLIFILGILFIVLKRRSIHKKESPQPSGPELHGEDIKELSGQELKRQVELSGHELKRDMQLAAPVDFHVELEDSQIHNHLVIHELPIQYQPSAIEPGAAPPSVQKQDQFHSHAGPVRDYLDEPVPELIERASKVENRQSLTTTAPAPLSEEELEIQWLAREEERIRERRELLQKGLQK